MRLIVVPTLVDEGRIAFKEFYNEDVPPYAILSHTWSEGHEVGYSEACNIKNHKRKTGYDKIMNACEQAWADDIDYLWVDTCCINKSSSAELSEAINSMFRWYQNATSCYVYLNDVVELDQMTRHARWFTRGWTLQELIAPKRPDGMIFFNTSWKPIGTKYDLCDELFRITNIDVDILLHKTPLSSICVGRRLSWAAKRKTKRIEDEAYCLLGILGINMQINYGEQQGAFYRLQQEIVRSTNDLTILAWEPRHPTGDLCGFFASSIKDFASCSKLVSVTDPLLEECQITVTNKGLELMAPEYLVQSGHESTNSQYALKLGCRIRGLEEDFLALTMRKIGPHTFLRAGNLHDNSFNLVPIIFTEQEPVRTILLTKLPNEIAPQLSQFGKGRNIIPRARFSLVQIKLPQGTSKLDVYMRPGKCWDIQDCCFFGNSSSLQNWGYIDFGYGALFVCFWHVKEGRWAFRGTLLDENAENGTRLRDIFIFAEAFGYQLPTVASSIADIQARDRTSLLVCRSTDSAELSFTVTGPDKATECRGPRWIVEFSYS
ncbi:Vegetative incompatibility protein [Paramyrothecium foliicola]|nr:Vegetative incompatibility protein [Paramyrothecium foliicola]